MTLITFENDDLLSSTGRPFASHIHTYDLSTFWYMHDNEAGFVKEGKGETIHLTEKGKAKLLSALKTQQVANEDEFIKLSSEDLDTEISYQQDFPAHVLEKNVHITDIESISTEIHSDVTRYTLYFYETEQALFLSKKGYERLDNILAHRKQQQTKAKFRYIQKDK